MSISDKQLTRYARGLIKNTDNEKRERLSSLPCFQKRGKTRIDLNFSLQDLLKALWAFYYSLKSSKKVTSLKLPRFSESVEFGGFGVLSFWERKVEM
jgi:hypothetical protein